MATELYMVEGDTGPDRIFNVTRDGNPQDLTGTTVKLILTDTSTGTVTNAAHQLCTLSGTPTDGTVTYVFHAGDIASPNVHFGDLQVNYSGGTVETDYDRILIRVRPKGSTVS